MLHSLPSRGMTSKSLSPEIGNSPTWRKPCGLPPSEPSTVRFPSPLARALAVSLVDASEMMRDDVFYGSYRGPGWERSRSSYFNRAKARKVPGSSR